MGIEMVPLHDERSPVRARYDVPGLAQPEFKTFHVPMPAMSIWMMSVPAGAALMPWWNYGSHIEDDLNALNQTWNIPSQQSLFDCLALSHLTKFAGNNLFAIFPGCVKTTGWGSLRQSDRETFDRGQGCVYHLFGAFNAGRFGVNWVPFWQPQSLVKNPNFGSLWRLFSSNTGDEATRCLTFFSLSNLRKLPEIVNLLINKDDQRSEKLVSLVDWFGVYSSPIDPKMGTCAAIYTQKAEVVDKLVYLQAHLSRQISDAQKDLQAEPLPRTALRIMSRQVAL